MDNNGLTPTSAWAPLRHTLYRSLWIATLISNLGLWMQNVGASWLMTSLTDSALLVALLQAATSLPVFLVGLPAGAIADIIDRRRLLLFTQGWMLLAATGLSIMTAAGNITAPLLLIFTFALGLGAAMNAPAWQAIVPEIVSRSELPAAAALGGTGINLARAIGPALAGIIVATRGPEAVFLINAVSFLGVIVVLFRWKRKSPVRTTPPEHFFGAMRVGIRYVQHAQLLQTVLIRAGIFIICGSALWSLLPVLVRYDLELGASSYGLLLSFIGAGAVLGTFLLAALRRILSLNNLVTVATIGFAINLALLANFETLPILCSAMLLGGISWLAVLSSLNASVQLLVPAWVQARAQAVYQIIFQGGMALGSLAWGVIADVVGITTALLIAAVGLLVGLLASQHYKLQSGENFDLSPALHWPEPSLAIQPRLEDGPVTVTLEYAINPQQSQEFVTAMDRFRDIRYRDGALSWSLSCDVANPHRYVEIFVVESWVEHKRQHERMTSTDLTIEAQARLFVEDDRYPIVTHLIDSHSLEH